MNRIASVLTGAITTALSGAAVAAATVGQGVFDDGGPAPKAASTEAAATWNVDSAAATAAATQAPQVAQSPRIVYVDKPAVVITTQAPATTTTDSAAQGTAPEAPTAAATPPSSAVPESVPVLPATRTIEAPKQVPVTTVAAPRAPERTATAAPLAPAQPVATASAQPRTDRRGDDHKDDGHGGDEHDD